MRKRRWRQLALPVLCVALLAGCSGKTAVVPEPEAVESTGEETAANIEEDAAKEEPADGQALFDLAVQDAVFAKEEEIAPLVTLTKDDELVSWDEGGRVLLCTWHNYPDSYPVGEKVTTDWGLVWAFTDKEIASHAEELSKAEDPQMRLKQLIAFAPDAEHTTFTGFWVDPAKVKRPAYQYDAADGGMTTTFAEDVDEEFKAWFDENILNSYFYGDYPWTRLGYTYDWADNGMEYGLTEFVVDQGAEVEVAFTETTEEFLERMTEE